MKPKPAVAGAVGPQFTEIQKRTAQAIVNIFETGRVLGDYGRVTLLAGDSGHLTYGRSQTTLTSGNLHLLIKAYCETPGSECAGALRPYLDRLASRDLSLDHDAALRQLLKDAGADQVMHDAQDQFFDRVYWAPSLISARNAQLSTGLGASVTYDSRIHGSWNFIRDRTTAEFGDAGKLGEKQWVQRYVETRRQWLATNANQLLQRTVYRMDSFSKLIQEAKWNLELPLTVRGVLIDEDVLTGAPVRVSAETEHYRVLKLETPHMIGDDVREVQNALIAQGFDGKADGVFGPLTEARVRQFQQKQRLRADGFVGPATRAALGL